MLSLVDSSHEHDELLQRRYPATQSLLCVCGALFETKDQDKNVLLCTNLIPRVFRLFGQWLIARIDSGYCNLKNIIFFDWLPRDRGLWEQDRLRKILPLFLGVWVTFLGWVGGFIIGVGKNKMSPVVGKFTGFPFTSLCICFLFILILLLITISVLSFVSRCSHLSC